MACLILCRFYNHWKPSLVSLFAFLGARIACDWAECSHRGKQNRVGCSALVADYPGTACTLQQALKYPRECCMTGISWLCWFFINRHGWVLLGCSWMVLWEGGEKERMCSMKEIVLLMEYHRERKCWMDWDGFWLMILLERALLLLCTTAANWETNTTFRV